METKSITSSNNKVMIRSIIKLVTFALYLMSIISCQSLYNAQNDLSGQKRKDVYSFEDYQNILNEGQVLFNNEEYESSLEKWKEGLILSKRMNIDSYIATFSGNIGISYWKIGERDKALKYLEDAVYITERINYLESLSLWLRNLGNIYIEIGNLDKAIKYFNQSLQLNYRLNNEEALAANYQSLGNIYFSYGSYSESIKNFNAALAFFIKANSNKQHVADNLFNLSMVYGHLGDYNNEMRFAFAAFTKYR